MKGWREREVDFLAATLLNCKGNKGWANGHMMSNKNCKDHTVIDNNANVHAINKARHARTYTHTHSSHTVIQAHNSLFNSEQRTLNDRFTPGYITETANYNKDLNECQ